MTKLTLNNATDALIVVDFQNDFVDGSLAVPGAKNIIQKVNDYVKLFLRKIFTQDMHPKGHSSFTQQGGPWPDHCVEGTHGAQIHDAIETQSYLSTRVYKGTNLDKDAYSAFDGTGLADNLKELGITNVYICGLATDYCVKASVLDALKEFNKVYVLTDAIAAVNVIEGDGETALKEMKEAGALLITIEDLTKG